MRPIRWAPVLYALMAAACSSTITPSLAPATVPAPTATPRATSRLVEPTAEPTEVPTASASSVAFWSAQQGIVVGKDVNGGGAIWTTSDAGHSWIAHRPALPQLVSVTVSGASDAWATATCDASQPPVCGIWASHDGGATWREVGRGQFSQLSFLDARHGWAVSGGGPTPGGLTHGGLFESTDGGSTWREASVLPCAGIGFPVGVSFVSAMHGWIACLGDVGAGSGAKGVVETADGGRTWVIRAAATFDGPNVGAIGIGDYLQGISMRPDGTGLAWEGRGGTLRTTDGGRHWIAIPPGDFDVVIPQSGWATTDRDWYFVLWDGNLGQMVLSSSQDAGSSWTSNTSVPFSGRG